MTPKLLICKIKNLKSPGQTPEEKRKRASLQAPLAVYSVAPAGAPHSEVPTGDTPASIWELEIWGEPQAPISHPVPFIFPKILPKSSTVWSL